MLPQNDPRMDSGDSAFFARQLEYVKAKTYDRKYPQLKSRLLLPISTEENPGAVTVTFSTFDRVGVAKFIANYGTDLPRADVRGTQVSVPVRELGSSYGYNVKEIKSSRMAGTNLETRKADAARLALETKLDEIGAIGGNGLQGLLNISGAAVYTVPNGAASATTWASKTAAEILADLNGIINQVVATTNGVEQPDTLIMPIAQYTRISSTPMFATGGSDMTILKFFMMNNPFIKTVDHWYRAAGAGTSGTDRMVAYRKDPMILELSLPQDFEQLAEQFRVLETVVPCLMSTAGVLCYYPLAVIYGDGI